MIEPKYHPGEEILLDYAGGSLAEPQALVVATHLAFCPECRRQVAEMEAIGGALLDDEAPEPVSLECLAEVMARLDADSDPVRLDHGQVQGGFGTGRRAYPALDPELIQIPEPLRGYLGVPLARLDWRFVARGMDEADFGLNMGPVKARLLRLQAGAAVPRHSHLGLEINLVLFGGYSDHRGHYHRGDLVIDDNTVDHRPIAEREAGCMCLSVTDAPLQMTGGLVRFLPARLRW
jgi:putative transcriptional regulator